MRHNLSTFEIDARLRQTAIRQLGLLTVTQAHRAGVDRFAIDRRRRAGALVPVMGHVLRLASAPMSTQQRIFAGALAVPGGVVAASSAAVVHGFPVPSRFSGDRCPVVLSVGSTRSVLLSGVTAVRQKVPLPSQPWATVRIATPVATLLLLPRFADEQVVERCLDHCIVNRLVTARSLASLIAALPAPAVHRRQMLLELVASRIGESGHRSMKEQHVGGWLREARVAKYRRNYKVQVGTGELIEVDFAWPRWRVALEVSPFFTHGSKVAQARDMLRRRLLLEAGWRILEVTDADLRNARSFHPTIAVLRGLLAVNPA